MPGRAPAIDFRVFPASSLPATITGRAGRRPGIAGGDRGASVSAAAQDEHASRDHRVRSHTYALLAALLAAPPERPLIDRVAGIGTDESDPDSLFGDAWRVLREAAVAATPQALDDEYHALFIGLGRGELVPYGSWYITGFMMDRPLAALRADLAGLGFERSERVSETEDHACALLEVMAMLAAEGEELASQRRFFARHLEPWMQRFFRDLRDARSASFYRAVGELGRRFMKFEGEYLSMLR